MEGKHINNNTLKQQQKKKSSPASLYSILKYLQLFSWDNVIECKKEMICPIWIFGEVILETYSYGQTKNLNY